MLAGLVGLPLVAWWAIESEGSILEGIGSIDPALVNIWGDAGFNLFNFATIIGYMAIGLGFIGSPQLFVRFISIKGVEEIEKGKWVAILFTLLTDSAAVLAGIFGRYLFTEAGQDPFLVLGNGGQNILPIMVNCLLYTSDAADE